MNCVLKKILLAILLGFLVTTKGMCVGEKNSGGKETPSPLCVNEEEGEEESQTDGKVPEELPPSPRTLKRVERCENFKNLLREYGTEDSTSLLEEMQDLKIYPEVVIAFLVMLWIGAGMPLY